MLSTIVKMILIIVLIFTTAIITYMAIVDKVHIPLSLDEKFTPRYPTPKGILSFGGGGLRALSADTGVMHGVSRRLKNYDVTLRQFLNKFQVISGNSGGSWFSSLMIYSPTFFNMLERGDLLAVIPDECKGDPVPKSNKWVSSCSILGMSKCGTNDNECCCGAGYKYNASNWTTKCSVCDRLKPLKIYRDPFTFEQYITKLMNTISRVTQTDDYFIDNIIASLPTTISGNYIKPFFYYYNAASWIDIVNNIVFEPVGDMENTKISDNPNMLTSHCVWAAVMLQNSSLGIDVNYSIGSADTNRKACSSESRINDCGIMYPLTFDYDLGLNASTIAITPIVSDVIIKYCPNYDASSCLTKNMKSYLSRTVLPTTLVRNISAISSAAAASATQTSVWNAAVDYVINSSIGTNSLKDSLKRAGTQFSISFNELSVSMKLNNESNKLEIVQDPTTSYTKSSLVDDIFTRTGDGGYYDNSSITNSVRSWQSDGGTGTCKIVAINSVDSLNSFQINKTGSKVKGDISNLFGCTGLLYGSRSCINPPPVVNSIIDIPSISDVLPLLVPNIFRVEDFTKERCLWWGRCSGNKKLACSDGNSNCVAELGITYFKTTTIDNKTAGVVKGTDIELYIITVNSTNAVIMPLPGSNDVSTGVGYVETASSVSDLMQKIPQELFDIVFLDQGDINSYTISCGDISICNI